MILMRSKSKELLRTELETELRKLRRLKPGSKEHTEAVRSVEILYKMYHNTCGSADKYIQYGLEAAKIVVPLAFYGVWVARGYKFEEKGIYTSKTLMDCIRRIRL